jgi:hypothetical protein
MNGGFEAGTFTNWTLAGDTSYTVVESASTSRYPPHSGTYSAALGSAGSLGYLSQSLATVAGAKYLLSFWLVNSYVLPGEFSVSWNGITLFDTGFQSNFASTGWTNIQLLASAATNNTVLGFAFQDYFGYLLLDEVSVIALQPAAPPSIAGISLSGTNLTINGRNGISGTTCYLLMSTNVTLPLDQWSPVATNVLNASGSFTITATNAVNLNVPQCFYILQMQ